MQLSLVSAVLLTLGAVAAVIGARRTSDRTLKRNIRLLAYALLSFVPTIVVSAVISGDSGTVLSDAFSLLTTYLLYLSVMSLTPLGRVES